MLDPEVFSPSKPSATCRGELVPLVAGLVSHHRGGLELSALGAGSGAVIAESVDGGRGCWLGRGGGWVRWVGCSGVIWGRMGGSGGVLVIGGRKGVRFWGVGEESLGMMRTF